MATTDPRIALRKRLDQRVRAFMLARDLWPEEGPLLLAVSGGPDSTALLLILARLAKLRRTALHVAYFDHGLRKPQATEQESAFVRQLSESLGLPFSSGRGDVRGRAKQDGTSIEDAARRERYDFLARTAREVGASHVATGHTASDQAETVLLHIIRGAGLTGLSGIAPQAAWPLTGGESLKVVRPLLRLTREETPAYCAAAGIEAMADETNASPDYARNRVRNELLPLLRTFNPKVEDALVRLADAARDPGSGPIRDAIALAAGSSVGLSARHIEAVDRLIAAGKTGDSLDLPHSLIARRTREAIVIAGSREPAVLPDNVACLAPGAETAWGNLIVGVHTSPPEAQATMVEVDGASTECLIVRRRKAGDRVQPEGMGGKAKKLQDLFVDAHVPREERDRIPIFESDRGIVWVGGLRIAEWAKPRPGQPTAWLSYRKST